MATVYVTPAELAALLGVTDTDLRVATATDAANQLVEGWTPQALTETGEPGGGAPADDPAARQAALQLAHVLYRAQSAVGGIYDVGDMLARLPADVARGIRDLLDAAAHRYGVG